MKKLIKIEEKIYTKFNGNLIDFDINFLNVEKNEEFFNVILDKLLNKKMKYETIDKELGDNVSKYLFSFYLLNSLSEITHTIDDKDEEKKMKVMLDWVEFYNLTNNILYKFKNLNLYLEINEFKSEKCYKFILKCINFLINEGVLEKKVVKANKNSVILIATNVIKSEKKLWIYDDNSIKYSLFKDRYLIQKSYHSIISIYTDNKYNNKNLSFIDNKELKNLINYYNNLKIYIDKGLLTNMIKKYAENIDIKEIDKKILKEKIKKIEINTMHFVINNEKYKDKVRYLSKLQKLLNLIEILEARDWNKEWFHLTFSFCFRLRLYFRTSLSPTFIKELRYCIHYGDINQLNYNSFNKWDLKLNKFIPLVKTELALEKIKDEKVIISIIWFLISLGNIKRPQLVSVDILKFISLGIEYYFSKPELNKLYDNLNYDYIIKAINNLINFYSGTDKSLKNWILSKDATGSVFQYLYYLIEVDKDLLYLANLTDSDYHVDTYLAIIRNWRFQKKIENFDMFNRNNLKKTMMVKNYGGTEWGCYKKFIKDLNSEEKRNKEIRLLFKDFYEYINYSKIKSKFNYDDIYNKYSSKNFGIIKISKNSGVDLTYYKLNYKRLNTTVYKIRYQTTLTSISDTIDHKKTKKSLYANFIHALDAQIARDTILDFKNINKPIITIHDCFMVGIEQSGELIKIINNNWNKERFDFWENKNKFKIESFFIVI